MKIFFYSHSNKIHFNLKSFALGVILKEEIYEFENRLVDNRQSANTSSSRCNLLIYLVHVEANPVLVCLPCFQSAAMAKSKLEVVL